MRVSTLVTNKKDTQNVNFHCSQGTSWKGSLNQLFSVVFLEESIFICTEKMMFSPSEVISRMNLGFIIMISDV